VPAELRVDRHVREVQALAQRVRGQRDLLARQVDRAEQPHVHLGVDGVGGLLPGDAVGGHLVRVRLRLRLRVGLSYGLG